MGGREGDFKPFFFFGVLFVLAQTSCGCGAALAAVSASVAPLWYKQNSHGPEGGPTSEKMKGCD